MFDRTKDLNWKKFKDLTFYAAMGVAGGGRNEVDTRFISMFSVFNLLFPEDTTLTHIYNSILSGHLSIFTEEYIPIAKTLIEITLKLFKVKGGVILFIIDVYIESSFIDNHLNPFSVVLKMRNFQNFFSSIESAGNQLQSCSRYAVASASTSICVIAIATSGRN